MADSDGKVRIIIDTNAEAAAKQLNDVGTAFQKNADTINKASSVYGGYEKAVRDNIEVLKELALGGNQNTDGFKRLAEQTKEYKRALDEANSSVNKAVGNLQQQSNPVEALTSKLKGLAGAYLSLQGARIVFNGIMESTEAFRQQERAIQSLNTSLANAGVYSDEYSRHIQQLASAIQSYSNYGDEAILKAQALGQSFIGQIKITDELTRAVVDFAAATGMDLEQAFTLVGKSIGSSTNALGRYGVELKKGMTDTEKMTAIAVQLGNRYEGQARQMASASVQLKNALGDLAEEIGRGFNPIIEQTQKLLAGAITKLTTFLKTARDNKIKEDIKTYQELIRVETGQLQNVTGKERAKLEQSISRSKTALASLQKEQTGGTFTNKKPVKMSDEIPAFSSYFAPAKKIKSTGVSNISGGSYSQPKQIKDAYDLATESVEKARRAVLNAGLQFGTSSPQVQQAFEQYKAANEQIQAVQDLFKIEETKTNLQKLQEEITNTTSKLQELYLSGQSDSSAFLENKNHLVELQTQMQDMNTAITSDIGVNWENVSNSIRSNLTSAILTPLQQGESAFDRLGKIGLNAVQIIGQEVIKNLVKEISLTKTLQMIKSMSSSVGGLFGKLFGSADGNVFNKGKISAFANGGIVNKPTIFPMANGTGLMGEAGPEAIMPLTRKNGKLGVEASGNQTVVNIYNQSQSQIETRKRDDGGMDIIVKRVNEALMDERTSGGFKSAYQREDKKGIQAC